VKVYNTKDDEVIMECPIQWGSLLKVRSFYSVSFSVMLI
jgi:hypothetical protein